MIFNKTLITYSVAIGMIATLAIVYKYYFIINTSYFPKCPFMVLTSYQCPGCGSQRSIHNLLNLNISGAFKENILLVISIPYLLFTFFLSLVKKPNKTLMDCRNFFYGKRAIYFILIIIFSFCVLRNIDA